MVSSNKSVQDQLINVCHRLYAKGFVTATDGNVSVRLENGNILTTRTAINKGMVTVDDLIETDAYGAVLAARGEPSTELPMHLYIYSQRPDVNAVVHAHPTYATGFATARIPLNECLFPEVIVGLGAIPLAEYATPSTAEVVESIAPYVPRADAILLANHGVVTYGPNLLDAYFKMEKVEHAAHITFVARLLAGEKSLTEEQVARLKEVSLESYGKDIASKIPCLPSAESSSEPLSDDELREFVRQMLQALR